MRRLVLLVLVTTALLLPCPRAAGDDDAPERTPYEQFLDAQLDEARAQAERVEGLLEDLDDEFNNDDDAAGMGDFMVGLLGLDALADPTDRLEGIELRRRQFLETPATRFDTAGLDSYARRDFQGSIVFFEQSLRAEPGRGLPHLFIGMSYLEAGDWPRAAAALSQALGDEHCEPTVTLLHAWAQACVDDPPAGDTEAGLRYLEVYYDLGAMVDVDLGLLMSGRFGYNESAALAWAEGALFNLRHERVAELLDEYETTDDPRLAEAIVYGLLPRGSARERIEALADRFPRDPALLIAVQWVGYMDLRTEDLHAVWPAALSLAEQMAEQDPDNGAYALMTVWPYDVTDTSVYDDFLQWEDDPDYDPCLPLTDAEVAALHRAAEAERFDYPGGHLRGSAIALRESLYGGFAKHFDIFPNMVRGRTIRAIARRYPNTLDRMIEAGNLEGALALGEAVMAVADRLGSLAGHDNLMGRLVTQSVKALVSATLAEHAQATGDRALMRGALALQIENWRAVTGFGDVAMPLTVSEMLPVNRLRQSVAAICLAVGGSEGTPGYAAYLLGMRQDPDLSVEDMLEDLAEVYAMQAEGAVLIGDYSQRSIVRLADLSEPAALPALRELAANEDDLFTSMLAQWAVQRIEAAE